MRRSFVAFAVALFVGACTGAATPISSTDSVSGSTTSATVAALSGWSRVSAGAIVGGSDGASMQAVTAGGPGLVAVGAAAVGDEGVAAVWVSADGLSWSRVAHDGEVFGGGDWQSMQAVTAGGPGLVAVGDTGSESGSAAAVWTSTDGLEWERVPDNDAVFDGEGEQVMFGVAAGGPGVVAVGIGSVGPTSLAAVWTSADGLNWSRVVHDDVAFGGDGRTWMWDVVAGGPGLVAVGEEWGVVGSIAAVWTSEDGLEWSRVPHDEAVFGGDGRSAMKGVTAGGPGLVAVGEASAEYGSVATVWTSADGVEWSRVPDDEEALPDAAAMNAVTVGGPGLVAVGWVMENPDPDGPGWDAAVWVSVDGSAWSRAPDAGGVLGGSGSQMAFDVAGGGPGLAAVGQGVSEDGSAAGQLRAAVWTNLIGD